MARKPIPMEFPADGVPADFSRMAEVLRHLLDQVAVSRGEPVGPLDWRGPRRIEEVCAVAPHPADLLSAEGLRREAACGRDAVDAVIALALRMGIEQSRRMAESSAERRVLELAVRIVERDGAAGGGAPAPTGEDRV